MNDEGRAPVRSARERERPADNETVALFPHAQGCIFGSCDNVN
jgi:hypothetical protein